MSNYTDFSFEFAKNMYEKSFRDLQVDYIDYYFLHSIGNGGIERFRQRFINNGVLDFLLKEREAGRIRNLGWSFHGDIAAFDTLFEMGIQWDFGMIQMNYIDWEHASPPGRNTNADYLYAKTVEHNVPVIIMEPLLGGRLANLGPLALNILNDVNPNLTPVEWAFRWLHSPNILTILSGMNKDEHVIENLATFSPLKPLNQKEREAIDKVTQIMTTAGYINCTGCDYCVPCPFGVDIPGILLKYNEYITAGKPVDPNDPLLQQAAICRAEVCNLCEEKCPQRIRIVRELRRIAEMVNGN